MPEKYRLQTVMNVRDRAKQDAGRVLAARRDALAEAEAELHKRRAAVERCRQTQQRVQNELAAEMQAGALARNINLRRAYLADLREQEKVLQAEVEQQQTVVARREQEVEQSLIALTEAAKELQVIEKHRDGWRTQQKISSERREQKLSDEIGAIIHRRNTK